MLSRLLPPSLAGGALLRSGRVREDRRPKQLEAGSCRTRNAQDLGFVVAPADAGVVGKQPPPVRYRLRDRVLGQEVDLAQNEEERPALEVRPVPLELGANTGIGLLRSVLVEGGDVDEMDKQARA